MPRGHRECEGESEPSARRPPTLAQSGRSRRRTRHPGQSPPEVVASGTVCLADVASSQPGPRALHCPPMRRPAACVLAVALCACARPFLARDGTLVFQEEGRARGVGHDGERARVPRRDRRPRARRLPRPVRALAGARSGSSSPRTAGSPRRASRRSLTTPGLAISLRPSDTRVPSWGGEMLVRVDVCAPAAKGAARWGERRGLRPRRPRRRRGPRRRPLRSWAGATGSWWSTRRARVVVPTMPASHRSLILAAIEARSAMTAGSNPIERRAVAPRSGLTTRPSVGCSSSAATRNDGDPGAKDVRRARRRVRCRSSVVLRAGRRSQGARARR